MEPQDSATLQRRRELYDALEDLLHALPQDAADFLNDQRTAQEPEVRQLLEELQIIGSRFESMIQALTSQLKAATWGHLAERFGLTRGDIIEVQKHRGCIRLIAESALPYSFEDDEFSIIGPRLVANGGIGKTQGSFFVQQEGWRKIGHFEGEIPPTPQSPYGPQRYY